MTRRALILALTPLALLLVVAAVLFVTGRAQHFAECGGGDVAGGGSLIGGPFTLTRQDGARVTEAEVIDGLTLIYFGYTYCPDICPIDAARNAEATALLDDRGISVKPVMITVDPARDTPEVMADFVSWLHPRMVGLTGTDAQIEAAKQAYRVYGAPAASDDSEFYLVDHSTFSYLMHPEAGLLGFYRRDASAAELADSIECFAGAL